MSYFSLVFCLFVSCYFGVYWDGAGDVFHFSWRQAPGAAPCFTGRPMFPLNLKWSPAVVLPKETIGERENRFRASAL